MLQSDASISWEVNGEQGTTKSLDVSHYAEVKVTVSLDKASSLTCVLHKGEYPVNYYVVTCNPGQEYEFVMKVKE